ncbi:1-phosphofructokinase family hexose kinase [Agrococcus sp. HG114]|uniref:1-phosphofructokinase family hexose kinase n=1 Tax=Agrococcus sp. HG114 TaxID=2969757 RepID=UPI00215A6771|nr:PfkB family carbohydrate kinase [Agrococcus sp. HG114]MCR8669914.1 PfkB family carbohydrate kinase [Agrococcus sp. HG114]
MARVLVFAPAPLLTVTIEEHRGEADVHVHVGGQGVWQGRMLEALGVDVTIVCTVSGETGVVVRRLLEDEGFDVVAVERDAVGPAYVHDRRGGELDAIVEAEGEPLSRHDLDALYSAALSAAARADLVILSGPEGEAMLEPEVYRRLASDVRELGATVLVDLAGPRLAAALEGGVDVLKVSHEELEEDGRVDDGDDEAQLVRAARALADEGVSLVAITRADAGSLVVGEEGAWRVRAPELEAVETRGAGDSYTAAVAAVLATGGSHAEAIRLGAAAGAVNATRRGLGTGDPDAIRAIAEQVELEPIEED